MTKFVLRWLINAAALYAAIYLVDGIHLQNNSWLAIVVLAFIFGLVNALLRPLLKLLTCPLIVLTLGLFTLLLNTFLFYLTGRIGEAFGYGFTVDGFGPAFLGALIVSIVSIILSLILKDELKSRRKG